MLLMEFHANYCWRTFSNFQALNIRGDERGRLTADTKKADLKTLKDRRLCQSAESAKHTAFNVG